MRGQDVDGLELMRLIGWRRRPSPSRPPSGWTPSSPSGRGPRIITLALVVVMSVEAALTVVDVVFPPDLGRAERSSPVALDRHGAWLRALPVEKGRWRIRADLDRTDHSYLRRLIALEDARFGDHPGVDAAAVLRASSRAISRRR